MNKELQDKLDGLRVQATAALEEIRKNTDESRTAELEQRHDAIMADWDKTEAQLTRETEHEARMKRFTDRVEEQRAQRRPLPNGEARGEDGNGEAPTYRQAFNAYVRAQGNEAMLSAEERSVLHTGQVKLPEGEQRALTAGTSSQGGYTVPTELYNEIVRSMKAFGPMWDPAVATEMVTDAGNPITIPTINDTSKVAGASGGEGVTLTDDGGEDPAFGVQSLAAYAFDTEWIRVSKELADDSGFAMEALLGSLLGERLGRKANLALTTGTGSSAPQGVVVGSSLGKTAAATGAITFDEILDLEHSVDPAYRVGPKVGYMMNDATLLAVRKLKDGNGNYLWQAGNVQAGVPNTINNRGYGVNQDMASLGAAAKVMLFGDFAKFFVRKVGLPIVGALQDKDFWPGFGMAGYIRFDGRMVDTAAVKHLITAAS